MPNPAFERDSPRSGRAPQFYVRQHNRKGVAVNDTRSLIITVLFAFVPYILISWGYAELIHGDSKEFWSVLGLLLLARLFFSIIETLGSVLSWRLYGKKIMVNKILEGLRVNNFPKREYAHDDLSTYLFRMYEEQPPPSPWDFIITEGSEEKEAKYPESLKTSAKEMSRALEASRSFGGILAGMRMNSAAEAALDIYSPRSEAPVFRASVV